MIQWCVIFMVIISFVSTGCVSEQGKQVRLNETSAQSIDRKTDSNRQVPLRVAVSSILSPRETLTVYQPLLDYLEGELGSSVVLLQRKTYKEVNELVEHGGADVAFVCSGGYVAGNQSFGMELLAIPKVKGEITYRSYIIAGSKVDVDSIVGLQGRSFAFTDPMSFSGRMAPVYMLNTLGINGDHFFGRTFFTYSHDNAIKSVADGIVDAAAVDSMIFDQAIGRDPKLAKSMKIIDKSFAVGNPPVVVHAGLDPQLKAKLQNLLLTMEDSNVGQKALASLRYDEFIGPDDTAYLALKTVWHQIKEKL